jgi:hypothetical protein
MKKLLILLILCCGGILYAQNYQIGDLYTAPDGSKGIVYYLHPDGSGGWVVALNDASTGCAWGAATDVPGLANQNPSYFQQLLNDTAGYTNTQAIRNYQNNSTTYAAGKVDFVHGWVLPSPAQLSMLYGQLPFVANAITGAGGTAVASDNYWCSAENDASNAWIVTFTNGYLSSTTKTTSCRVRAVRSFTNSPITYDTALTYQWNTGSTQPFINVNPAQTTTYQVTATSDYGCSNTAEQTVLVGSGSAQTIYDTICKGAGYEVNGFTLTSAETGAAGTLTRTRTMTTSGCSSNLTLQLKVNEPETSTFSATATGNYTWNGVTYYESGDYTQHFNSAVGCDSVVTLRLTITPEVPLPDNVFDGDCVLPTEPNAFTMVELFNCPNVNSMSTPMVADMDGDGLPEVLACCYASGAPYYSAGFHVINGQTGELKYTLNTVQYVNSGQMVTIADVDYDGKSELFLLGSSDHKLYCYNYNGGVRWMSSNTLDNNYLLSAADVNNDGVAEIVCGKYVYDAQTGVLLLQGDMVETGMGFGAPHGVHMPYYHIPYYMYALGDVDGDGTLEVCAGNTIYKMVITNNTGTAGNSWSILRQAETPGINNKDGETFLVDFDNDGDFDVCVIGISHSIEVSTSSHTLDVYVWDGQTSQLMAHTTVPVVGKWGASIPYSGDLNGDGYPEIIFAVTNIGMLAYTYDTVTHNFSEMHHYAPFGETAGFTVFDFNQDGQNEIVYRGATQLFIADGITLANLCPPVSALSGTIAEYPVVADVNADGHAEIVITRQGGGNGVVSVFGSAIPGAWSSARKVWNQWAYSSVNINEDMTVPQYRFNVATEFPNGEKPFNTFLHQMPYIDTQGNLFNPVTDVAVTGASASSQEDTVMLTLNCCNNGDMPLLPYPVTVYANAYGGNVITTVTVMESIPVDSCVQQVIRLPKSLLCEIQGLEALVVAVNNSGSGIAQNGGQQSECDTTNNTFTIPFQLQHVDPVELTVSACDSYEWNGQNYTQSGDYIASFPHPGGCDSVVTLHLTIEPTPNAIITSTADTICESGEVMLHAGLDASYGPVLHVPAVAVGDILCTDNSIVKPSNWPVAGKTAMGIVFYVDSTGVHGWAVHLQDQGADIRWSPNTNYTDVLTLANFSHPHNTITDMNGYSNTHNLRLAGDYTLFPAAYAVDFANGWYLPAAGQLRLLVAEVITMNNSLQIVNGMPFSMNSIWGYWSSTEADNLFAWQVNHLGNVTATDKNSTIQSKVRSVRNF